MGGATRVLQTQLKASTKAGHEALLISGAPAEDAGELPCPWISHKYKSLSFLPALLWSLRKARKSFHPEVLHIHQPLIGLLAVLIFKKDTPRVYHFHSFWRDEKLSHAKSPQARLLSHFKGWIEQTALKRMDHFIVLSDFSKKKLIHKIPSAKVEVIPGAVNSSLFSQTKSPAASIQRLNDKLEMVSVRRLDPRMGLDILIEALSLYKEKHPQRPFHLSIIGDGRQRIDLEKLIQKLNLNENVTLMGRVKENDLIESMQRAEFSILPTRELEGFGLSVIESFSAGSPVLATSVGALPEYEKFSEVFHAVGEANSKNLLSGLEWAHQHWKGHQLQDSCMKVVQDHFSEEVVSQKLLAFYHTLKT